MTDLTSPRSEVEWYVWREVGGQGRIVREMKEREEGKESERSRMGGRKGSRRRGRRGVEKTPYTQHDSLHTRTCRRSTSD